MVAPTPVNALSNCDECHSKRCPFCSRCHAKTICPVSIPPCTESVAQGLFVAWSYEPGSALALSYCGHHKTHTCPNKLCPKHDSYSCGCYACDGSPYRQQTLEQQRVKILSFEATTAIDLFPHTAVAGMA